MKITHRSKLLPRGYATLLTTLSLSLAIMAFAIGAFRETRQAHRVQSLNQVKIDYGQKERAFLRALLHVTPNAIMNGMMRNSGSTISTPARPLNWPDILQAALNDASVDQALTADPAVRTNLSISANVISANTGDSTFSILNPTSGAPTGLITAPDGSGNLVMSDTANRPASTASLKLPPQMQLTSGFTPSNIHPFISLDKRIAGGSGPGVDTPFSVLPYPKIAFNYNAQGDTFLARRNWWAFTVNFGANTAAATGIAPSPRTYVLSIYEVPSQLAVSSAAGTTTSLGQFADGTNWSSRNISVNGNLYADQARIEDISQVGSVASRQRATLGATGTSSGQTIGGTTERRNADAISSNPSVLFPFSSSSDSGLVSFLAINRGFSYFDYFAALTDDGRPRRGNPNSINANSAGVNNTKDRLGPTAWDTYSIAAAQTAMRVEITETLASNNQLPTVLHITARTNGGTSSTRQRVERGPNPDSLWRAPGQGQGTPSPGSPWPVSPAGDDWFVQSQVLSPSIARPCITLDLTVLQQFLTTIGADGVDINNSIWIGPNHRSVQNANTTNPPSRPTAISTDSDMTLLITNSDNLTQFTNGLSIITPLRVYFADDLNSVEVLPTPPGETAPFFNPVSVSAPEKRFGVQNVSPAVNLGGRVAFLPQNTPPSSGTVINPLDIRDGATNNVKTNIQANLTGITKLSELPPISPMNWLTVIEEIK